MIKQLSIPFKIQCTIVHYFNLPLHACTTLSHRLPFPSLLTFFYKYAHTSKRSLSSWNWFIWKHFNLFSTCILEIDKNQHNLILGKFVKDFLYPFREVFRIPLKKFNFSSRFLYLVVIINFSSVSFILTR